MQIRERVLYKKLSSIESVLCANKYKKYWFLQQIAANCVMCFKVFQICEITENAI